MKKRIHLRRFTLSDFSELSEMLTDIDIVKSTGFRVPQNEEQIRKHLKNWVHNNEDPLGVWAIVSLQDQFIGWAMLKELPENEAPELGYMIRKELWGKGFATEVTQFIIHKAFHSWNFEKVIARTDPDNTASINVLLKNGMELDARLSDKDTSFFVKLKLKTI